MDRTTVWYQSFGLESSSRLSDLFAALAAAGIRTDVCEAEPGPGPGLVLFEEITEPLCEFIRGVSRGGLRRVLAVTWRRSALASGGAWRILRVGGSDVIAWDHSPDPAGEIAARIERWATIDRLVDSPLVQNNLLGRSPVWIAILRQVVEAASFTDSPVLITGESGTGKELVAQLIHSLDRRQRKRELVVLDCATIVPELSGSEFFGHERGAFTGAVGPREGAFALADQGTLFLDEIGELPLPLQAQLLRVVQERTFKRVGGNRWQSTHFRLICATNRPLHDDVLQGRFRADLFYRIASVVCQIPPLRQRPDDIIPLFEHFFAEFRSGSREPPELDEPVREYLLRRPYPGNVRDLKQLVARIALRHVGPGPITVGDLPEDEWPASGTDVEVWNDTEFDTSIRRALAQGVGLKAIGRIATEAAIRIALDDEEGNLQRAAQRLGVTDRALQMRKAAGRQNGIRGIRLQPRMTPPTE